MTDADPPSAPLMRTPLVWARKLELPAHDHAAVCALRKWDENMQVTEEEFKAALAEWRGMEFRG